ncbi:MAG: Tn3 family transposase [Terriglobia bacterium]|jgi:TnpA family transposase
MPVSFLTEQQRNHYGRFAGELSPEQLTRYFHLDDRDRRLVNSHRGEHSCLGFAIQLCTARFLGTFLEDLSDVPAGVINCLARQLQIQQLSCFFHYRDSETRWDHAAEIRRHCGFRDFGDPGAQFRLNRWLYALCWTGTDRPGVLFDRATTWLIAQKVLLPAVTTLERHIARLRSRVEERVWSMLAVAASQETRAKLEALLSIPESGHQSLLDRLRKGPYRRSAPELVRALDRVEEVRRLGITLSVAHRIPTGRLHALARFASTAKISVIRRLPESRRLATLVAFASKLEAVALDDALDLLDILITEIFSNAVRASDKARLRTIKDLDAAALQLTQVCRLVLDPDLQDAELRSAIFKAVEREELEAAVSQVDSIARPPEDVYYRELAGSYARVRRFLPHLLQTVRFDATPAGQSVLEALNYLLEVERGATNAPDPPVTIVNRGWRRYVGTGEDFDRKAYVFCCLDRVRSALRRRDIFIAPSVRHADARLGLLSGSTWTAARPTICRSLGHSLSAEETVAALSRELDQTYRTVVANLPSNPGARVEQVDGKDDLIVTPLDKLDEPDSLVKLRAEVNARLPRVDLPEVLLEIAARTEFTSKFTHVSERESRMQDLPTSLCANLIAEACNIGLEPLTRNDVPALRRARLSWVSQNFIRNETLADANACLVTEQNKIALVQQWGGGEVASADGLRFVVPVRTLHAGPNPKYFGFERGVTYYNLVSDQFTGLNAIVIPGTLRDSLYLLAVVLEQQTELHPTEIMTDTGAYTDVVFGLFWLLGYRFCPRIADIGGARYWRIDPSADYGSLNGIARHRINTKLIEENWDDMLRLAGSLKLGMIQAASIMKTLRIDDRPTKLAQAVAELGRIDKTVHALTYIADENKRRRTLTQLNRGEDRHKLARAVFHGKRGELRQRYREGQEDQLGALGLVVNIMILWNTLYINAALDQLVGEGYSIQPEDVARLSPLVFEHINLLGRYAFTVPDSVVSGQLRPLRNPADALEDVA